MKLDLKKEIKNEYNNTTKKDLNEFLRILGKNIRSYSRLSADNSMGEVLLGYIKKDSDDFYENTKDKNISSVDFERVEIWFDFERKCHRDKFLKELLDKELLKFKNFFIVNKKN